MRFTRTKNGSVSGQRVFKGGVSGEMTASREMCVSMSTQQIAIFGDKLVVRREETLRGTRSRYARRDFDLITRDFILHVQCLSAQHVQ